MNGQIATGSGSPGPPQAEDQSGSPIPDATFDRWLTHHLQQLYDPVTDEPIPADLLRLLDRKFE